MLRLLPDATFPITHHHADALMENVHQFNILDGALNEKYQRALGIYFHVFDLWVKSKGKIDYRGKVGNQRLIEDAMRFVGTGNPVAYRHGDLAAAHLSIDYHDTQMRLKEIGQPPMSARVSDLLVECQHIADLNQEMEKRTGLLMDYLGKKPLLP